MFIGGREVGLRPIADIVELEGKISHGFKSSHAEPRPEPPRGSRGKVSDPLPRFQERRRPLARPSSKLRDVSRGLVGVPRGFEPGRYRESVVPVESLGLIPMFALGRIATKCEPEN